MMAVSEDIRVSWYPSHLRVLRSESCFKCSWLWTDAVTGGINIDKTAINHACVNVWKNLIRIILKSSQDEAGNTFFFPLAAAESLSTEDGKCVQWALVTIKRRFSKYWKWIHYQISYWHKSNFPARFHRTNKDIKDWKRLSMMANGTPILLEWPFSCRQQRIQKLLFNF